MILTVSDNTAPAGSGIGIMRIFPGKQIILIIAMGWAFCLPLLVSCSPAGDSPETQVRTLLERGETAAEKRQTGELRQMISEKYSDSQGQDKRAIEAILRYYFLRHESIHLFVRIQSIAFPQPAQAQASFWSRWPDNRSLARRNLSACAPISIVSRSLWRVKTRNGRSPVPSGGARSPAISSEAAR